MKKLRVGNSYVTNIELSCGELYKVETSIEEQPASFREDDAIQLKAILEEYYKNKDETLHVEIVIEDV